MSLLDMRTVMIVYAISNLVCMVVVAILWQNNRKHFAGLGFWLADFVLQFLGVVLVALRGVVPDIISMTVSNAFIIGGTILLFIGLELFTGKRGPQIHNYILLAAFILVHPIFIDWYPSLRVRNILLSTALLVICSQCAWLLLVRVDRNIRSLTQSTGLVFVAFSLASLVRIGIDLAVSPGMDYFHSDSYSPLMLVLYQMFFIALTFSLFLIVNNRLFADLVGDINARRQAETALRTSEERYQAFISQSFQAIYRTEFDHPIDTSLPVEEQIDLIYANASLAECNQGMVDMYGLPSVESMIGMRLIDAHGGSDNPVNRSTIRKLIESGYRSVNDETMERNANGHPVWFLNNTIGFIENGYLVRLWGTSIDITGQKKVEEALRENEAVFSSFLEHSPIYVFFKDKDVRSLRLSRNYEKMLGMPVKEALGKTMDELFPSDLAKTMLADDLRILNEGRRIDVVEELNGRIYTTTKFPIFKDGQPHMLAGFTIDITEEKKAEAALQRQNEIWEALQQTTLDLLSQLDLDSLLENIVKRAGLLMGTQAGYLDLVEPVSGQLMPRVGIGALAESLLHPVKPGEGVAGTVWQTGKPLIIEDYDRWPGRVERFSPHIIRSIVGVPLKSGGRVLGVLGLAYDADTDRVFSSEDAELLTQFARLVTIAIENARLYQAAQDELAERKRIEAIVRLRLRLWEFAATHSTQDLMKMTLDEIEGLTGSLISFYHFVDDDQNSLSLQAWSTRTQIEFCKADGNGLHYPVEEAGVWVECVHLKKPVIHNDYASLPHRKGLPDGHAALIRELVVPIIRAGRVVSILGIGNKPTDYDEQDVELVWYIADVIWSIVEQKRANEKIRRLNGQLGRLAMTDELTGLANRRSFFLHGRAEVKRARRYETTFSLLMLDIDSFKKINDTHGHEAGDRMLQCVARTIQECVRETDLVARLGGEEFAVLLPNTPAPEAVHSAERVRQRIEHKRCSLRDKKMQVTVSIGGVEYSTGKASLDDVLRVADAALYQAKDQGRNRVVFAK